MSRLRPVAVLLALCLLTAGAGWSGVAAATPERAAATSSSSSASSSAAAASYDGDVAATIAAVQDYWAATFPDVYGDAYDPIPSDRLFPYSEQVPPPGCGTAGRVPYEEVAGNAFYCSEGDFVAWDEQGLIPQLERDHGRFAVALVLAHEFGHAIQARVQFNAPTVYLEQQADCFAGSWAQAVADGDTDLSLGSHDLDTALSGFLQFRDPPGIDPSQEGAHGNAFDRVSAFQDGFEDGAARCADYESNPPEVTETAYGTQTDYENGGDLPLSEIQDAITPALDTYWTDTAGKDAGVADIVAGDPAACDHGSDRGVLTDDVVYCTADDRIIYRTGAMERAYDDSGDFGAGMLIAAAYSSSAASTMGRPIGTADAHLEADCLTGAWTGAVSRGELPKSIELSLSPGDLDEAVLTFVALEGRGDATAFDRVRAFRTGFDGGADACIRRDV